MTLACAAVIATVRAQAPQRPKENRTVVPTQQPAASRGPQRRLFLSIGNSTYRNESTLANAANDARDIASALGELGFVGKPLYDLKLPDMEKAVDAFIESLHEGDVALVYYSGHGTQVNGENFLLPVEFKLKDEADIKHSAYSAQRLHDRMVGKGVDLAIQVLDACRNNPWHRGDIAGWGSMLLGKGSFIVYATAPGKYASDNPSAKNGLFATYLLPMLAKPDLTLADVFDETVEAVKQASHGEQSPWVQKNVAGKLVLRDSTVLGDKLAGLREQIRVRDIAIAAAAENVRKAQTDQQKREAQIAEEQLKAKQDFDRQEEVRLARQAEDARALEARRIQRARDAEALRIKTEQAIREAQTVLDGPVPAPPSVPTGDLTVEQARTRVAELEKQVSQARRDMLANKAKALAKLDEDYAPSIRDLSTPPVRGPYQQTKEYNEEVAQQATELKTVREKLANAKAEAAKGFDASIAKQSQGWTDEIQRLRSARYRDAVVPKREGYDPDTELLTVSVGSEKYSFSLEHKVAAPRADSRQAFWTLVLTRDFGGGIVKSVPVELRDRVTGERYGVLGYEAGAPPPYATRLNEKDGLVYVWIPPGKFRMGCSPGDAGFVRQGEVRDVLR